MAGDDTGRLPLVSGTTVAGVELVDPRRTTGAARQFTGHPVSDDTVARRLRRLPVSAFATVDRVNGPPLAEPAGAAAGADPGGAALRRSAAPPP